jgi:hypothetical protein
MNQPQSTDFVTFSRLEVCVPAATKQQIEQQAAQAKKPVKFYCGEILSKRTRSFTEIANSFLELNIKLDAIIGTLYAIERSIVQKET